MMTKFTIINNVKNIVRESHLKNYAIAEKCGYSPKKFSDLLCGRKRITETDIMKLYKGLNISPNDLFGYKETA